MSFKNTTKSSIPSDHVDITLVMPCLNEEDAIGMCIDKAFTLIKEHNLNAEILIVDNGSTDKSAEIAKKKGARVVFQPIKGYGSAYKKGFKEARGKYILMADADNTYDFSQFPAFIDLLENGYDLVVGNRFSQKMASDAMTWSHRYIGNPILSSLVNIFFRTGVKDIHSGMRAITKDAYVKLQLKTDGMDYASEMIIIASVLKLKIAEVPITYNARVGISKLRTIRDGWKHLSYITNSASKIYVFDRISRK